MNNVAYCAETCGKGVPMQDRDELFQISSFMPYAEELLHGGNESELLKLFFIRTETGLCLRRGQTLALEGASPLFEEQMRTYPYKELARIFHRIVINREELIFNYPLEKELTPLLKSEVEHLSLAIRLLADRRRSQLAVEQRYREQFIQDLLFSRIHYEEELRNRSATYGWKLSGALAVLVIDIDAACPSPEQLALPAKNRLRALFPDVIFSHRDRGMVFLIPLDSNRNAKRDLQLAAPALLRELDGSAVLGLSGKHDSFLQAGEAYREASKAVEILRAFFQGRRLAFWDDLGAYKLLSDFANADDAGKFVRETLGVVITYDRQHNGELMETLQALDQNNWNLRATAAALYVHYNTMKYRCKKLEELLPIGEENGELRFSISLALRLYRMQKPAAQSVYLSEPDTTR